MNLSSRLFARVRLLVLVAGAASVYGVWRAFQEISANRYLALHLTRNAARTAADNVNEIVLLATGLMVVFFFLEAVARATPGGDQGYRSWGLALGFGLGAVALLHYGWIWNRYEFAALWKTRHEWLGLPLRRALFDATVWRVNLTIVFGSLGGGFVVAWLVRWTGGLFARAGARLLPPPVVGLLVVFVLLTLAAANGVAPLLAGRRHVTGANLILISLDTLRSDRLGCYGHTRDTSPALDRLASQGVLFRNCYSQAPNTFPSHASLFTSRYPTANQASLAGQKLPRWRTTAAEIFREAGYRTSAIVDAGFLTDLFGMAQGYDDFVGWGRRIKNIRPRAQDWLEEHGGHPFFLFLHCYDIHAPYAVLPQYQKMFQESEYHGDINPAGHYLKSYMRHIVEGRKPPFQIGEEDVRHLLSLYDGGIRYTDDQLAILFDFLEREGFLENTIVVVFSDHGEAFMEHGNVLHTELYRPVTAVPLIIRFPTGMYAGRVVKEPVGLIDVLPTLLELTGVASPVPMEGRSLVPLMEGRDEEAPPYVFSEFDAFGGRQAVYRGSDHYVNRIDQGRKQLFDVSVDPLEQDDRAAEDPELLDSLSTVVEEWVTTQRGLVEAEGGREMEEFTLDPKTRENLRALGYIE